MDSVNISNIKTFLNGTLLKINKCLRFPLNILLNKTFHNLKEYKKKDENNNIKYQIYQ
jgi:hypothetical protein